MTSGRTILLKYKVIIQKMVIILHQTKQIIHVIISIDLYPRNVAATCRQMAVTCGFFILDRT